MQIFSFQTKKVIESLDQGSYEIRQWTINLFTSPMIIDKIILSVDLNHCMKSLVEG